MLAPLFTYFSLIPRPCLFGVGGSGKLLLAKRGIETVFLAECRPLSHPPEFPTYGRVAYYGADTPSTGNHPPDGVAPVDSHPLFTPVVWEGSTLTATFSSTGVTFTSDIGDGPYKDYQLSGFGDNSYRTFECFRDNQRELFTNRGLGSGVGGPDQCYAMYYCI